MRADHEQDNNFGYTFEALRGIKPNGRSEPDGGMYGNQGVKAFVRKYGSPSGNDTLYFTGTHRVNNRNSKTGLTMAVRGFNPERRVIEDVGGAVELLTDTGHCAAAWSFSDLMISWNKKHAQAAYVPYESEKVAAPAYRYLSPALLGEGTDFNRYLSAMHAGLVIFDPGSKVMNASTPKSSVKARSQFRMSVPHLGELYQHFGPEAF